MTVCAWCDSKIVVPAGLAPRRPAAHLAPVSHGICPSCVAARIAALPRPALSPALALR
jgi:hypothetical protein